MPSDGLVPRDRIVVLVPGARPDLLTVQANPHLRPRLEFSLLAFAVGHAILDWRHNERIIQTFRHFVDGDVASLEGLHDNQLGVDGDRPGLGHVGPLDRDTGAFALADVHGGCYGSGGVCSCGGHGKVDVRTFCVEMGPYSCAHEGGCRKGLQEEGGGSDKKLGIC